MYFLRALAHRMAFCKSLGNEFVILFAVSFSTLIHCISLVHLSGSQRTSDEGDTIVSDMSDEGGFYEQLADFDYPIDDYPIDDYPVSALIADLQRGAVETTVMSDQEGFFEQLADFDYPIDDAALSDLPRSAVETTSYEGDKTLSDMSDQEGSYEPLADFDYPIDDDRNEDDVSDLQRSAEKQGRLVNSSEEVWDAISPKLRCGDDFMKLQLLGSDVDQVKLCRASSAPVPLGHLPPDCGHTSPTHGGLVFETPYDGCGVAQQGGNYVMQMLLQGNPVVISCPMTSSVANMTTSGYQPPRFLLFNSLTPGSQKPQPPGYANMFWQYYYPHYHHGRPKPDPTSAPTTTSAVVYEPTQEPRPPGYPNRFWPYYYPHYNYHGRPKPTYKPVPTSASTTSTGVDDAPQLPANPHLFWPYYYPQYPMQPAKPQSPTVPSRTTTPQPCTTTAAAECNPSAIQPYVEPRKYSSVLYE